MLKTYSFWAVIYVVILFLSIFCVKYVCYGYLYENLENKLLTLKKNTKEQRFN